VLEERLQNLETSEIDAKIFGVANWPFLQAFILGRKAEIRDTIKLLTLDQRETNE
jgi:hypothetical protein